ncbi:MAG TPA: hypothetical protein VHD35_11600 [Chitinophagaceae bacterium]|nr:hypothetical protein [Chitinophagaceae bacterium]
MEENLFPSTPAFKLYKDRAIYVGTFLGGPLVAGYLAAENFKQLGQTDRVKTTWIIAILATMIIFGAVFLIPNIEKVPNYIIPLIYTGIAQFLVQKYQGLAIKTHIAAGGQTYSVWRAVWIGLVGLAILIAIIFVIILLTNKELLQ